MTESSGASAITVTDDLARIDLDVVHRWLSTDAYRALGPAPKAREVAQPEHR